MSKDLEQRIPGISDTNDLEGLNKLVGELNAEERAILKDPALHASPTEEELREQGPNFGVHIARRDFLKKGRG